MRPVLPIHSLSALLAAAIAASPSSATVVYDEALSGDLSGDFTSPTPVTVAVGINSVAGQVGENGNTGASDGSDADYFEFTITPGQTLTEITIEQYSTSGSPGSGSFLGYSGAPLTGQELSDIQSFLLFNAGTADVLPTLGVRLGNITELGPGTHRFWVQETSPTTVNYQLGFRVVPEPTSLALLGLGGLAALRRRR